jgi:hypothetical protein
VQENVIYSSLVGIIFTLPKPFYEMKSALVTCRGTFWEPISSSLAP